MNILIVGSSSGLGKEIFEQNIKIGNQIYAISKYSNNSTYENHLNSAAKIVKTDLTNINTQKDINLLLDKIPQIDQIYFAIGGGFGKRDTLPSFEDIFLVYKINVFVISSMIKYLNESEKINKNSKICIISSVASQEVTASPAYSSAKSALNTFGKVVTKQKNNHFGSLTNFICGAFEGNGTGFDRLKSKNIEAYNDFISSRLPNGKPLNVSALVSYIIKTMDSTVDLLDGLTIKIDGNESFSI